MTDGSKGDPGSRRNRPGPAAVIPFFLAVLFYSADLGAAPARKKAEPRWESNLSFGYIRFSSVVASSDEFLPTRTKRHLGVIKSVWYYPFPLKLLSLGLSLDYVIEDIPLSLNVALNLPSRVVVPFVSVGAGASLSGTSLQSYGAGVKMRLQGSLGVIAEYRHFRTKKNFHRWGQDKVAAGWVDRQSDYLGFGIAYLF